MSAGGPDDAPFVPIASYPKSGNTWVRAFLSAYLRGSLDALDTLVAPPIFCSRELFDEATGVASSELTLDEVDRLRPAFHRSLAAATPGPWFVKLHDRWYRNLAGEPVFARDTCRGAIFIVRHPAAVAISYAHHLRIPFAEAVEKMADDAALHNRWGAAIDTQIPQRLGSWSSHATSWLDQHELPTLAVRYEDLLREPESGFEAILAFAGIEPDQARVSAAVSACGFDRLRALESKSGFAERAGDHPFFREGRGDSWRSALEEGLRERLVADHGAVMARFGYGRGGAA